MLSNFVDPRDALAKGDIALLPRATDDPNDLVELHRLCRESRIYEVERWIAAGRPLQLAHGTRLREQTKSALKIALEARNHALVHLLLCNGYEPNLERDSPLNEALQSRRWDLVDLLLEWGTDPRDISGSDLLDTYNSKLFERFRALGVDLTAGHELAYALGYHTSNKPLFGFVKRHREDPKIQKELDIALAHHASEENEKGIQMCL